MMAFWQTFLEDASYIILIGALIYITYLFVKKQILDPMDFDLENFIKRLKGDS